MKIKTFILKLQETFLFGKKEDCCFKYLGLNIIFKQEQPTID